MDRFQSFFFLRYSEPLLGYMSRKFGCGQIQAVSFIEQAVAWICVIVRFTGISLAATVLISSGVDSSLIMGIYFFLGAFFLFDFLTHRLVAMQLSSVATGEVSKLGGLGEFIARWRARQWESIRKSVHSEMISLGCSFLILLITVLIVTNWLPIAFILLVNVSLNLLKFCDLVVTAAWMNRRVRTLIPLEVRPRDPSS